MRVARINTSFTDQAGQHPVVNVEIWETIPADTGPFTFRNVDPPAGYIWAVGPSCSVKLGSPDQYFDMTGNPVVPVPEITP